MEIIKKKFIISSAIFVLGAIAAVIYNYAGSEISSVRILRIAHPLGTNHPIHESLEYFGRIVENESKGKLLVRIYPAGQLGSDYQTIEQLQYGIIPLAVASCGPLESFIPQMQIFGVPYVFRNKEHLFNVLEGGIGRDLLAAGSEKGLKGLCFFDAGARSFYTRNKPVNTVEDLKGLKIRVMKTNMCVRTVQAMGASPAPIDFGELYTALQQGVVDGAENNPPSFYTSMHYEICKYYILDEHLQIPDILLISEIYWKTLPPEYQNIIISAAKQCSLRQQELWKDFERHSLEQIKNAGVEIIEVDKTQYIQAVKPLWKTLDGTPIAEMIKNIQEIK